MRYFLKLAYDGTSFHGWQVQPNAMSVQATIESALSTYFQSNVPIVGAGRTDTGVHAKQMYAHFDSPKPLTEKKRFLLAINSLVGKDIEIEDVIEVSENAHARFDATQRTYKYFVSFSNNPFLKNYFWYSPTDLNMEIMNEAASMLISTEDFTSFAKLHSDAKTNICKVSHSQWLPISQDQEARDFLGILHEGIVFTITADRFLRNMVRAIVGTLIDIGRNKISISQFQKIILDKNRCSAGTSMPSQALFLWRIKYPFISNS